MKKEIKDRWVKALRSGKYKQIKGKLYLKDKGFCCLGVLCDIYSKDSGNKWEYSDFDEAFGIDENINALPSSVQDYAGLSYEGSDPEVKTADGFRGLIELNDAGKSFKEIADLIEAQL